MEVLLGIELSSIILISYIASSICNTVDLLKGVADLILKLLVNILELEKWFNISNINKRM